MYIYIIIVHTCTLDVLRTMPSLTYLMINSFCLSQIKKEAKIEPSSTPLTTSALVVSLQEKIIEEKKIKRKQLFHHDLSKRYTPQVIKGATIQNLRYGTKNEGPPRKVAKGETIWKDRENHNFIVIQVYHILIT